MTWAITTRELVGARESGAITLTHADVLLAVYVLRALDYEVSYTEDVDGARPSANLSRALRAFQGAANRDHARRLTVDGRLGPDTLNALSFYAVYSPHTVARLSSDGLTTEEQRAVQAVINARKNNAWGGGSGGGGGSNTGGGGGSNTGGSNTGGGGGSNTGGRSSATQAGFLSSTGGKAVVVVGVLGALALGGSYLFKQHEANKVAAGEWSADPYGAGDPLEPSPYDLGERGLPAEPPPLEDDALRKVLRRQKSRGSRNRRMP
jgi:hypothetical protein